MFTGILIGIFATIVLDLWAMLLNRVFGFALPNWAMVGRWFAHLIRGRFAHDNIADATPVETELGLGWAFHYAVGALFGVVTVLLGGETFLRNPTLFWPMVVGLVTVGCGWFILQPGMGAGIAASKRPDAVRVRVLNIIGHIVFGLAMYVAALLLK